MEIKDLTNVSRVVIDSLLMVLKQNDVDVDSISMQLSAINGDYVSDEVNLGELAQQTLEKLKTTPEGFVLDAPARVGGGIFREGVKWKTVIESAQRLYEHSKDEIKPIVSPADLLKIASGDLVLVPKESLKIALFWMDEDIDPWQMGGDSFADLYEHKPILEKALEAQEQSHD